MNRIRGFSGITALALLLISTSGWAQTDLGKRVSIDVNTVSPQEVFGLLARSLDCEISIDPQVQQPVTLRVVNVTARTALSVICESIGCRYRLDGKKMVIEPLLQKAKDLVQSRIKTKAILGDLKKPLPKGMRFENASLSSVLEVISKASGMEVSADPAQGVKTITVDVSGQPLMEGLKQVLTLAGADGFITLTLRVDDGSERRAKIIVRTKK
jgi:type II secretory pathway component GspD/PulD (secretin)